LSQSLPLPRIRKRDFRLPKSRVISKLTIPASIKKLAQMPMTIMGLSIISSAIIMLTLVGGLMFIGVCLILLEYVITEGDV
jgi:hypothetical protein